MKTAISLPDSLSDSIDAFIKAAQMSRSEFFQRAARLYLSKVSGRAVTRNLDDVYRREESPGDAAFRKAAVAHLRELLDDEAW